MARCERSPHLERLTLKDFLVKPFQRLTKYPLLLKVCWVECGTAIGNSGHAVAGG